MPRSAAAAATVPETVSHGRPSGSATISQSCQCRPGRRAERLGDRLLGREPGGERLGPTRGLPDRVVPLGLGEEPVGQQRRASKRPGEPLDQHHVIADGHDHSAHPIVA